VAMMVIIEKGGINIGISGSCKPAFIFRMCFVLA
jgi:hypothetical protein